VLDYLKQPNPTANGFSEARKECHRQIRELANQLKAGLVKP